LWCPPYHRARATELSFAASRAILAAFVPDAPSTEVIEHTVLALGRHTAAWFEHAPAQEGDGEVLVILFNGKGAPTATESELCRRRGKRRQRQLPTSPRHRGRRHRRRYGKRPRRKKGDKSKNARIGGLERNACRMLAELRPSARTAPAKRREPWLRSPACATQRGSWLRAGASSGR
jgi:hypothetical protein